MLPTAWVLRTLLLHHRVNRPVSPHSRTIFAVSRPSAYRWITIFPGMVLYVMTLLGVAIFAVSGVLRAGEKGMDFFGVVVIAAITSTGCVTFLVVILGILLVF